MKKSLFAVSALALAVMSGSAMAANDVQFIGAVTDTTCNLVPEVNGATVNVVHLGTVATGAAGKPVEFTLKRGSDAGCSALTNTGAPTSATIGWQGPFNAAGLSNQSGTATGAVMTLKTVNAKDTQKTITNAVSSADFDVSKIATSAGTADGAKFEATLTGGATAGTFISSAAFAVAYK